METTKNASNKATTDLLGLANQEAEAAVIHAMRVDVNAAVELCQELEEVDFHDPRLGLMFEAIRLLLLGMEPIDNQAILSETATLIRERKLKIRIDLEYIDAQTQGDPRRFVMYAHTIKKLAWLRKAADFTFWMAQELQGRPKPEGLFTEAMERWQRLAPRHKDEKFVYGWDTLDKHGSLLKARVMAEKEGNRPKFNWPWRSWNQRVRPLYAGFVGLITAADGMGKSTYLEEIAEHWARQGINVVYVHLEDDLEYKLDRRMARYAKVPIASLQDGTLTEEEQERVKRAEEKMEAWAHCLHYYDAAGESIHTICRELQTRVDEGVCQALVIDYIDKLQPSRGQLQTYGTNTWERQANDMEQLKVFCAKNRLPAMSATQGNKTMQGGAATRQAISGSSQKSHKSQLVIVVKRELWNGPGDQLDPGGNVMARPGEYSPLAVVRIDKQNIGMTGEFRQYIFGRFFSVYDIPEPKPAPAPEEAAPTLFDAPKDEPKEPVKERQYKDD